MKINYLSTYSQSLLLLLLYKEIKYKYKINKKGIYKMKLRINRIELLNSLNKVSRAVNSKTPLLALTGIKFTLTENYLELIGSDSDLSIRCIIEKEKNNKQIIEIEEIGSVVINEKIICEIIRKVDSEMVEISLLIAFLRLIIHLFHLMILQMVKLLQLML